MRNRSFAWLLVVVAFGILAGAPGQARQASSDDEYVGKWTGTWDGSGSGGFELTLEKGSDGAAAGKVAVTTEQGNYTAELKSVSITGKNMTATYDFPLDPAAEVAVAGAFEGRTAKGTWSLRPKGQSTELAGGAWTVSKK
jgi:hypothetical protein